MGLFDLFKTKSKNDYNSVKPKQEIEPKEEIADDEDFNPFDINSLISWYKRKKPDATEEDIVNFIKKLAEPEKDQDHLTPEGDLPWGWHRVHEKDIKPIEQEYKKYWQAWFDSRSKSPLEHLRALEIFVNSMVDIKILCEKKGECFNYWRTALFSDDYLQRLSKELDDYRLNINELESAFQAKLEFETTVLPTLEKHLMQIINESPGILQKDIYKMFAPEGKSYIQEKLYYAEKNKKIIREK